MAQAQANGITIEYEIEGPEQGPVLLMINGLGSQLIRWPRALCDRLIETGFRILRYDSRDIGLSSHMVGAPVPDLTAAVAAQGRGEDPQLPYDLADLAADAAALLGALRIPQAHVLGLSLGGMVAQLLAIEHPKFVLSLNILMSTSANPDLPPSNPLALEVLATRPPSPFEDREAYLAHQLRLNRVLAGPHYQVPDADLREFATRSVERAWNPSGSARQLAAIQCAADRRRGLRLLTVPTLVIHGAEDPLILPECGEDIAENVPEAWMIKIHGMGHAMPPEMFGLFTAAIRENAVRAQGDWKTQ